MSSDIDWDKLTDVERTCLGVAFARWHTSAEGPHACKWPDGKPWYSDPLGPIFVRGIPPEKQQELAARRMEGEGWIRYFVAVRTAELDNQISEALKRCDTTRQLVLLGAGMDTRAWRLPWPPVFSVFEVDSPQVLSFKNQLLLQGNNSADTTTTTSITTSGDGSAQQQQQQQEEEEKREGEGGGGNGVPPLSCQTRTTVAADASKPEELWSCLTAAGFDGQQPVVWLLEGFIGYLTVDAGSALLSHLASRSAPGSSIIVTCPPGPEQKARSAAALAAAAAGGGKEPTPDAKSTGNAHQADAAAAAAVSVAAVTHEPIRLHHSTFEEPTDTLERVSEAGWSNCRLLTADELAAKYGVEHAQPIVLGTKA